MRLSRRILQRLDADRVRRVNEIYHNLENASYDQLHEDIPQFEERFWREAAGKYIDRSTPITWLDYGAGTGFVAVSVAEHLRAGDTLICCDVSGEMLAVCKERLDGKSLPCRHLFEKIDGTAIPAPSSAVDIISVNSVLHHMYDLDGFAAECVRVLNPGGLLIVAHEPNADRSLPFSGRLLRCLATVVFRPRTILFRITEWSPLSERLLRWVTSRISPKYRKRNAMLAEVARQIRQQGLFDFDLRGTEIQQIVDFHSQQGFVRDDLLGRVFGRFTLVEFRTYGHLGFFPGGRAAQAIERYLRGRWPGGGREICFVLRRMPITEGV
ncbi:MAG: class I SAM-dependent methyltransferase [Sedimentisphaerales bacterium]|jgi:ubiquinone/menaquinone biosynthesis C-methylase UbiE|nr:class I SAM-dependent methyltransferase [Sedimentisphaerales bacterium]HNY79976.1 class I SAM-dependent methyltransferase [Sedimentisphaerales bacterium]HOC64916.1 class I SAM-dependent methyltransferase [Sedimentisphaerales bacterium]HOH65002.1 class I SAM-dependent methyltransferase [Sedimentisphaerales bacterium]HPY50045.1 class I SAM-dependent methyltransferase [Sedimentisphaerales bacterium]